MTKKIYLLTIPFGILDDKSDPHSGSESSASEELSQHSNSIVTSSASPIVAAFTNSNSGEVDFYSFEL